MKKILVTVLCSLLMACGFHLRGLASIPFESLYVSAPERYHIIRLDLKRAIESGSKTLVPDNSQDAEAIVHIISAINTRHILSLNRSGKVREYELRYLVSFRVTDAKGQKIMPVSRISLRRILPYDDGQILAKIAEKKMLEHGMKKDAVQQIMQRLEKIKL